MKKSRLSKTVGLLLILLGGVGFVVTLNAVEKEQKAVYLSVPEQAPLNNTNSLGLAAIASAMIVFVGGRLIEESSNSKT